MEKRHRRQVAMVVASSLLGATAADAGTLWNESVNGDLSDDRFNPTALSLQLGVNSLFATTGSGAADREYFSVTVPTGMQLSELNLVSYVGSDNTGFIGVQQGSVFTEPPTNTQVFNLLGWSHIGPSSGNVGQNILDDIGWGGGAIGYEGPLPAGTYTYWVQQLGSPMTYQLDYVVTNVPAPSAGALMMLGVVKLGRRHRAA
ncbi:MAG TPA: hypothetical protein VG711_05205 [Phycisphaerales bacterium]|nr:hypothetical protein [Phycisphaerales bacterium]